MTRRESCWQQRRASSCENSGPNTTAHVRVDVKDDLGYAVVRNIKVVVRFITEGEAAICVVKSQCT